MRFETLTLRSIRARAVRLKLKRPVVARIATLPHWPIILIDLLTEEGIVGRSYLELYTPKAMRYLIPALHDFGDLLKGRRVAPVELYELARKSLHFVGYQGLPVIAVSGLEATWDALAKAAGLPHCVLLGGLTPGPVKTYNNNGLWLRNPELVAAEATELRDEGGFTGLKLRLGRENARDDLGAIQVASRLSALRKMPCVIFPDHVSDLMGHAVNLSRPSFLRRIVGDASLWGTHKVDGVPLERISEALAKEVKPIGI